jgi:DNA-binding CsgD family transcriptional regulator
VLYNGLGEYHEACAAAQRACASQYAPGPTAHWAPVELVEAASRSGDHGLAAEALERLVQTTQASRTDWALGIEARSRALTCEGEEADRLYREAIDRLARTRMRVDLARAHLLYGEWLRRERRRTQAREQLSIASETFTTMGMEGFADRAARELQATGATARKRTVDATAQLTPQEAQIARLARGGLTNKEIAGRLYVSTRTIEYHLHKVFTKLGIASRHQLDKTL